MTSVAFQIDQLFAQAPGGIGMYVRKVVPALARRDPALDIKLFHARFPDGAPERWMRQTRLLKSPSHSAKGPPSRAIGHSGRSNRSRQIPARG